MNLPADPFAQGIEPVARNVRSGKSTFADIVTACLQRIEILNPRLQAFEVVCADRAVATAEAFDQLLANGTDLGPLMGMPVAIKDIIAVDGMPTTNGSLYQPDHLALAQGAMVDRLLQLGCVIVGKVKTVEFALGATGENRARGTPWNVWDAGQQRIPGGSSSGSAVATAAGLCAFAIGTDTGGSVRIPACFNGLFGHKTTIGLWPTDGVFALSPTLDSIGPLCRTAADASLIHRQFNDEAVPRCSSITGMKFGLPSPINFDDLDPEVAVAFDKAQSALESAGAEFVEIQVPENRERLAVFAPLVGAEIIASLTREGFAEAQDKMDPVTSARASIGLDVDAVSYLDAKKRHQQLIDRAEQYMEGLTGWITPTCPMIPMTLSSLDSPATAERSLQSSRNTQMINLFGQCAATLPIHHLPDGNSMPVGLQLIMPGGQDARLLSVASAFESILGRADAPDIKGFTSA